MAAAAAAQSKDLADIAAIRKAISDDVGNNDKLKLENDKVALQKAYDDLVRQSIILKASGADANLLKDLGQRVNAIKDAIATLIKMANNGKLTDVAAMDAALLGAVEINAKIA